MSLKWDLDLLGGANQRNSTMSKIAFGSFVSKAGKEYRTLEIAELLKAVGLAEQVDIGFGVSADKKSLILWEPRAEVKEAKAKGIMGKPLSKMAEKPVTEGVAENPLNDRLATIEKALAMLISQNIAPSHAENARQTQAPVGTTIIRKRKAA